MKQETVSGSGISWAICKSAPRSRQIITPAPHHSVFYRPDALPATQPTVSKHWRHKALKPTTEKWKTEILKSKKMECSEVSVNSLGNLWSQTWRRKGRLRWKWFAEKKVLSQVPDSVAKRRLVHISQDDAQSHRWADECRRGDQREWYWTL